VERFLEKIKDVTDQLIDIMLNFRQSGHPGGSRSKVHMFWSLMFSGKMKYDIRHPEKPFADRFILSAGHNVPLIYAALSIISAVFNEKYRRTGNEIYKMDREKIVQPEDLLMFRRRGGLPGHAEFSGKTLFLKFNTGPSGHGLPASVGQALALKRAGAENVRVWVIEGDKALTTGVTHESMNSAYALGLDNLFWLIDWNNYGIDEPPLSATVYGAPSDWFSHHGWRVLGTPEGENWREVLRVVEELADGTVKNTPNAGWFKNRKGRGYLIYDNKSHGTPHKANSELYWKTKEEFMKKYGVEFDGFMKPAPKDYEEFKKQTWKNIQIALSVLTEDDDLVEFMTSRMLEIAKEVPEDVPVKAFAIPKDDPDLWDPKSYPEDVFFKPGEKAANRNALKKWGAYINYISRKKYGHPIFLAASADLSDSTNISGFAKAFADFEGYGWYDRNKNPEGVLLPQGITEMANAGISVGVASVNFSKDPYKEFVGYYMASSTYGSFAYLKYGPFRLFSQLAQDCPLKLGKVLWIAGHSGPETADDSRTHFGIFSPGVTRLFPKGQVVNLHPWEANEVPVVLAEAFKHDFPIVVLHLTRPPIEVPDREKLGIPSHFEAAKGAYLIRDFKEGADKDGTLIVRGTMATVNLLKILPEIDEKFNLKIVAAISRELFDLQPDEYKNKILPWEDWMDSTIISTESLVATESWIANDVSREYAMTSDWDNRWRTGGTVDEVIEEAHLDPEHLLEGIERFVRDKDKRRKRLCID
jgi:transketolase